MGDRFDRRRPGLGERLMQRRGVPPPTILSWGLEGGAARIGHNNGPPLEDDSPGYVWRRYRWKTVHAEVWRTPPLPILKFRLRRAEAAGLLPARVGEDAANAYRRLRQVQHRARLDEAPTQVDPAELQAEAQAVRQLWQAVLGT